jgi:hypothetical protein
MELDARTKTLLGVGPVGYTRPSEEEMYGSNAGDYFNTDTKSGDSKFNLDTILDIFKTGSEIVQNVKATSGSNPPPPAPRKGISLGTIALIGVGAAAAIGGIVYLVKPAKKKKA